MSSGPQRRSLLVKPASGDCNLHCAYCFYHDRPTDPYRQRGRHRMGAKVLDALIQQGMRLGPQHAVFGWQGGEPTLAGLGFFKRAVELQKQYGTSGQSVSNGIQTNGLLLDPEWARFLREYSFLVGVSLDGPAAYHDHYRTYVDGSPTHQEVLRTLHMLARQDVEFNVLAVVNRLTADHGAEIYEYFLSQGFYYMQFIPCVEIDPSTGELADFAVESEQFGDFLCQVFDRWYNGGNPEASVRDFEAILAVYLGQEAPLCCYQEQCGSYLVVEYNGNVYPCDFLVERGRYLGNLLDTSLQELFESPALVRFAAEKAIPRRECQTCAWLSFCNQGCPRFLNIEGQHRHHLCRAYRRFYAHSQAGFMHLRDRVLMRMGMDPQRSPKPPTRPVGRNDPCPCGSGRKYKNCCGWKTSRSRSTAGGT